jgi:8-oxo-dGTP pyrophosphatase MutT (NUDIX family)
MSAACDPIFRAPDLLGLARAEQELNEPLRRVSSEFPLQGDSSHPSSGPARRLAEIVMVLPRPDGILFHTKSFYPEGTLRLPTGGVHRREPVLAAARREVREETGLDVQPTRFLFHLCHRREGAKARTFHSLAFLYPTTSQPVAPTDPDERITELRAVAWDEFEEIVRFLENLEGGWRSWGRFRAVAHRVLLECRTERPEWFGGAE